MDQQLTHLTFDRVYQPTDNPLDLLGINCVDKLERKEQIVPQDEYAQEVRFTIFL